jgi:hypothetical protein
MSWHAVDAGGRELSGGGPSAPAALAGAPVVSWPLAVATSEPGRRLGVAAALGPGGERVEALLDALMAGPAVAPGEVGQLAGATPAGVLDLPVAVVDPAEAVEASAVVDPTWLGEVDRRRGACRQDLVDAGREAELEAAVHLAALLATERFDPDDDTDVAAHVASGARLWLLTGGVTSALSGVDPDPFAPWARLVVAGWWPVGPSDGRLVVGRP